MSLRTGREFVAGLDDGRRVYVNGELVRDITQMPAFAGVIRELADLYDLQHNPQIGPEITWRPAEGGDPFPCSLMMVRDWSEMARRIRGERIRADAVNGMMGRLPDFVNAFVTDF